MPTGERRLIRTILLAAQRKLAGSWRIPHDIHPLSRSSSSFLSYESSGSSMFFSLAMISTWSPFTATSEANSSATVGNRMLAPSRVAAVTVVVDVDDVDGPGSLSSTE